MFTFPKPFAIGLKPLDCNNWIIVDDDLVRYLKEKDELIACKQGHLFQADEDTIDAQREVFELLRDYVLIKYPNIYSYDGEKLDIKGYKTIVPDSSEQPLLTASRFVQEDLILMRKRENGWSLVAASLAFPSSWSLLEKFQKSITQIHEPVPGFGDKTRNAMLIERIFDKLLVDQPVTRENWGVYADDVLRHSTEHAAKIGRFDGATLDDPFVRVEGQTLRKLPTSNDILFTVRIYVKRASTLIKEVGGKMRLEQLVERLAEMSEDEAAYKGISTVRDDLIKSFNRLAKRTI